MLKISTNTSSYSAVETPDALALELEADLLEWFVNFLVSIPENFKTVIIHLDTVDADTPRSGPMILINMFANTEIIICVKWDKFN